MGYERAVVKAAAVGMLAAAGALFLGPAAAAVVADGLPRAREAAAAWLTPPYLYLVINAIIISIAASSRFQPAASSGGGDRASASAAPEMEPGHVDAVVEPAAAPPPLQVPAPDVAPVPVVAVRAAEFVAAEEPVANTSAAPEKEEDEEEFSISRSSWTPRRRGAEPVAVDDKDVVDETAPPFADLTNSREKPLVSARFGRKAAKPSPEGSRALRVARPRKEETLESTWKAITEGRRAPLARHLKKSDTWDTRGPGRRPSGGGGGSGEVDPADAVPAAATMRKAETFIDGRSKATTAAAPVRREPSLGQDELNRRVEAFINKFNMEMRLQRQESLKHYNEMLRLSRDGLY